MGTTNVESESVNVELTSGGVQSVKIPTMVPPTLEPNSAKRFQVYFPQGLKLISSFHPQGEETE